MWLNVLRKTVCLKKFLPPKVNIKEFMNDILYIMRLPGTGEMRYLSECFNIYTKVFQNVFAVGGME